MSMDDTAISLIQNTAVAAAEKFLPESVHGRVAALPDNHSLQDLERFHQGRFRFRGKMVTDSIADFVLYCKDAAKNGNSQGFIDAKRMTANVFFNLGDVAEPGHGDWSASLKLEQTAAFSALLNNTSKHLTQKQLVDFIEDWGSSMQALDENGASIPLSKAIAAIRKLKIKATSEQEVTQGDFKNSRSKFDDVEASSSPGLPTGFTFTTEPCFGLPARTFALRLSVLTEETPKLILRVIRLEEHTEAIAQDFKAILFRELFGVALYVGTFTP